MNFSFSTEIFKGISDQQIFEVFCRLNMNGVALNAQELRNAKFFGLFKQTSYRLALEQLEFWRSNGIFSEQSLARMMEVQLTSELLIAGSDGMQDKKTSVNDFYRDCDNEYSQQAKDERRFRNTMSVISETFDDGLSETEFNRPPLFYSLYCVVYHHVYGLPGIQRASPKRKLRADDRDPLREAVVRLSEVLSDCRDPAYKPSKRHVAFLKACARQTDNINPRMDRFNGLYDEAF